jgi:hypothetical protein
MSDQNGGASIPIYTPVANITFSQATNIFGTSIGVLSTFVSGLDAAMPGLYEFGLGLGSAGIGAAVLDFTYAAGSLAQDFGDWGTAYSQGNYSDAEAAFNSGIQDALQMISDASVLGAIAAPEFAPILLTTSIIAGSLGVMAGTQAGKALTNTWNDSFQNALNELPQAIDSFDPAGVYSPDATIQTDPDGNEYIGFDDGANVVDQTGIGANGNSATSIAPGDGSVSGSASNTDGTSVSYTENPDGSVQTVYYDNGQIITDYNPYPNGQLVCDGPYVAKVAPLFSSSMTDPLVIDLSGNGVQLTPLAASNAYFDLYDTGYAVHTGWVGPGTGLLVENNGGIFNITDLFGSSSTDGFTALEALDVNHDGVINVSDPGFASLEVWTDTNGNGVVDPGELQTLTQLGITSINLTTTAVNQDLGGNVVKEVATYTRSDGTTGEIAEAYFDNSQLDSQLQGTYQLNPLVFTLPNLRGYGTLPDLYVAMSLDPTLLQMVETFSDGGVANAPEFEAQTRAYSTNGPAWRT